MGGVDLAGNEISDGGSRVAGRVPTLLQKTIFNERGHIIDREIRIGDDKLLAISIDPSDAEGVVAERCRDVICGIECAKRLKRNRTVLVQIQRLRKGDLIGVSKLKMIRVDINHGSGHGEMTLLGERMGECMMGRKKSEGTICPFLPEVGQNDFRRP